jgi:hypothetical protein
MKEHLERRTLAESMADRLEEEIRGGILKGNLPGRRLLAQRFGVNWNTAEAGITLLEKRGLVAVAELGKRRRILAEVEERTKAAGRLLILHQAGVPLTTSDAFLLRDFQDVWESEGGLVFWKRIDFRARRKPAAVLETLIESYGASALVMLIPSEGWCGAAADRLPFFQLGGDHIKHERLTLCAFGWEPELASVVRYLGEMGHSRVMMPVENEHARVSIEKGFRQGLGSETAPTEIARLCPAFPESEPKAWRRYWKKCLSELAPTAVVTFDDRMLLSLYTFCGEAGIRIPRDLSVVSMEYDERFEWMLPAPTMMQFPRRKALPFFRQWLAEGMRPMGRCFLNLEMLKGGSVRRLED